jgi:TetR/AcrR family transcriptional regulator
MNQFYDKVELACKQSLRVAVTQGHGAEADVAARASLLVSYVVGRWHRYAKSGFRQNPTEGTALQLSLMLAA